MKGWWYLLSSTNIMVACLDELHLEHREVQVAKSIQNSQLQCYCKWNLRCPVLVSPHCKNGRYCQALGNVFTPSTLHWYRIPLLRTASHCGRKQYMQRASLRELEKTIRCKKYIYKNIQDKHFFHLWEVCDRCSLRDWEFTVNVFFKFYFQFCEDCHNLF